MCFFLWITRREFQIVIGQVLNWTSVIELQRTPVPPSIRTLGSTTHGHQGEWPRPGGIAWNSNSLGLGLDQTTLPSNANGCNWSVDLLNVILTLGMCDWIWWGATYCNYTLRVLGKALHNCSRRMPGATFLWWRLIGQIEFITITSQQQHTFFLKKVVEELSQQHFLETRRKRSKHFLVPVQKLRCSPRNCSSCDGKMIVASASCISFGKRWPRSTWTKP